MTNKILKLWINAENLFEQLKQREEGMTTAEYAVGTIAAVAFAGVLILVVKSGAVQGALTSIIQDALATR